MIYPELRNYVMNITGTDGYLKLPRANSLAIQWLGLHTFTAVGPGLIPGRGTKIPHAAWCASYKQKYCHSFSVVYKTAVKKTCFIMNLYTVPNILKQKKFVKNKTPCGLND